MRSRAAIEADLNKMKKEFENTIDTAARDKLSKQCIKLLNEYEMYHNDEPSANKTPSDRRA